MICIISATNRHQALTLQVAQHYQNQLQEAGITSQILDLQGLPPDFAYSALYQNAGKNPTFNQFQEVIDRHEKFIFVVPEYNGSFPGVLKTFIDGLRYPGSFQDKKAALVGLSSGMQGGALALSHLSDILAYLGTEVLSLRLKLYRIEAHFAEGKLTLPLFQDLLQQQMARFLQF
ncbi:MAG: hypothetical protein OHK0053_35170 [Microscillaceae bacterium]